jgi:molybdopterin molybdotransferase
MDGYAVRAADLGGASADTPVTLPVRGEIAAGDTGDYRVEPGSSLQIMTGARLPEGADAVVPVEWTDGGATEAVFRQAPEPGNAVRHRGDDVAEAPSCCPRAPWSARCRWPCWPRRAMAVLARTPPGSRSSRPATNWSSPAPPDPRADLESNSFMLAAAPGGPVRPSAAIACATTRLCAQHPRGPGQRRRPLITSGGVSMGGEHDVVKAALSKLGTITFRGRHAARDAAGFRRARPGRHPIFTLPGNPVSAYVSFILFVQPALIP